ncbi:MAG: hypothetical protein BWZ07_01191 [Alphaproteobacteria bacterium ADurb.BinA280]|nr:MAG: hypothetical protein BWZ07_01191 [Alphaproteobacteria bacterium ADurb.BinA280]
MNLPPLIACKRAIQMHKYGLWRLVRAMRAAFAHKGGQPCYDDRER